MNTHTQTIKINEIIKALTLSIDVIDDYLAEHDMSADKRTNLIIRRNKNEQLLASYRVKRALGKINGTYYG